MHTSSPHADSFEEANSPTVGFNMRKVKKGGVSIKLWDMGGQERFRPMWERYCRGVQASRRMQLELHLDCLGLEVHVAHCVEDHVALLIDVEQPPPVLPPVLLADWVALITGSVDTLRVQ
jgi:hypothetical protein